MEQEAFQLGSLRAETGFQVKRTIVNYLTERAEKQMTTVEITKHRSLEQSKVIDNEVIEKLLEFVGPELIGVLEFFFDECQNSIDLLESDSFVQDASLVRAVAHQRKGSSNTFGMLGLADAFSVLQSMSQERRFPQQSWFQQTRRVLLFSKDVIEDMKFNSRMNGRQIGY